MALDWIRLDGTGLHDWLTTARQNQTPTVAALLVSYLFPLEVLRLPPNSVIQKYNYMTAAYNNNKIKYPPVRN